MNRYFSKKALLSICLLTALNTQNVQSMSLLRGAVKAAAPSMSKYIVPATVAAGVGIAMSIKAAATRYLTLGAIQASINPTLSLDATPEDRSVYNWNLDTENFRTVSEIKTHQQDVRQALIQACTAGQVNIYKYDNLTTKQPQGSITWQDLSATLDKELKQLDGLKKKLEPFVDLSCNLFHRRIHLFGVKKNYQTACASLGITKAERMTEDQERDLDNLMSQDRTLFERTIAFFMFNPNYDKAHKIYWQVHQRYNRLQEISAAIASSKYEPKALITQSEAKKVS